MDQVMDSNVITYEPTEELKTLKHEKDVCKTNKPSLRSETVKDKSLEDLIAERKILAPVSRWPEKNNRNRGDDSGLPSDQRRNKRFQEYHDFDAVDTSDAMNMSLDALISQSNAKKSAPSAGGGEGGSNIDKSLAEIIGAKNGTGGRGQKRKREEEEEPYVMNPLEVVEKLTNQDGLIIEQEFAKQTDHGLGRSHNWRATIACGELSVTVEATFKDLARQAAAFEIIKIMREIDPKHFYPRCVIPEGCFYDNAVVAKLEELVVDLGLEAPRFETRQLKKHNRDYFSSTYFVGEDEFEGHSHSEDHSRLFGAKAAYETYSQKKFPREKYHVTEEKSTATTLRFHESEAVHAMSVGVSAAMLPKGEDGENGVPPLSLPEEIADEEELLIDDCGRLYARSSTGSNKIRRLMKIQDICPDEVVAPTKKFVQAAGLLRSGAITTLNDQFPTMDEDELDYGEDL